VLAGERYTLCLTLGALAELEHAFGAGDLAGLGARFETGRLSADDVTKLLGAGLRGGGHPLSDRDVAALPIAGGLGAIADAIAALLQATFGDPAPNPPEPQAA
jgi:hypothetical protein